MGDMHDNQFTDIYGELYTHDPNAYYTSLSAANDRVYELEAHMRAVRRWKFARSTGAGGSLSELSNIIEKAGI